MPILIDEVKPQDSEDEVENPLNSESEGEAILSDPMKSTRSRSKQDSDAFIQGLTPAEIRLLAEKVYDLLRDELRIEAERHGRTFRR